MRLQMRPRSLQTQAEHMIGLAYCLVRGGGGCEIRTREGLPPTRFPSVRPRPLGESSAGQLTGAADPAGCGPGCRWPWLDWATTPRTALIPPTPPGPEGSKGTRALAGVRGVLPGPGKREAMAGDVPSPGPADPARRGAPAAPAALYRRYRPATFAELKGQDHVTEPLR